MPAKSINHRVHRGARRDPRDLIRTSLGQSLGSRTGRALQRKKGCGSDPHPFLIYKAIISIPTTQPDNFSNFILPADTETYGENRENGGLTRIAGIEGWISRVRRLGE